MIDPKSARMLSVATVDNSFLDTVRDAVVKRGLPSKLGTLTKAEREDAFVRGLVRMVQRAARHGTCAGACDLISNLHGQDVLLVRLVDGVLIGLALDREPAAAPHTNGRSAPGTADPLHAFDLFEAGRHAGLVYR
ncbi:hypothetical protein [Paraburkholderia sp. J7]|uniref:hypothetical protein n=1 Tax=Paraburkholderia sp. J7 TaxID=2805438 RepID=UPI002AB6D2A3|nr:hypothetical protein [Paraburkholderia sp. J7]